MLGDLARKMAGVEAPPYDPAGRKRLKSARRMLSRWRSGSNPDTNLSTVSWLATALGEDPLGLLAFGREDLEGVRAKAARVLREPKR